MTHPAAARIGRVAGHGLTLAYREWNPGAPGDPLVLFHGITGSSADWSAVATYLDGRRIIALDARGHGESDWDPNEAYAGDSHFADAVTALDALGIQRCVLAGYSMGGGVGMLTAAGLAGRVAGLVVVDTYPHPQMTTGSRRIAAWVSSCANSGAWFDPAIARQFRTMLEAGSDARLDLWPIWEAIECPVLIVRGAQSDVLTAECASEMLARQPRSSLSVIPGVSHPIPFHRPRELALEIDRFGPV